MIAYGKLITAVVGPRGVFVNDVWILLRVNDKKHEIDCRGRWFVVVIVFENNLARKKTGKFITSNTV